MLWNVLSNLSNAYLKGVTDNENIKSSEIFDEETIKSNLISSAESEISNLKDEISDEIFKLNQLRSVLAESKSILNITEKNESKSFLESLHLFSVKKSKEIDVTNEDSTESISTLEEGRITKKYYLLIF